MHLAARLFLRHARALTALVLGACVLAGWGGSRLEVDDQPTSIIRSDDAAFAQMEEVFEQFGSDDGACLLLLEGADPFSPAGVRGLRRQVDALEELDGVVTGAVSLLDMRTRVGLPLLPAPDASPERFEEARAAAAAHPLVAGKLLGSDGTTNLVVAQLADETLPVAELRRRVRAIEAVLVGNTAGSAAEDTAQNAADNTAGSATDTTAGREPGASAGRSPAAPWRVSMTGVPPLRVQIFDAIRREQVVLSLLAGVVGAVISFAVFRRLGPVLITSAASLVSAWWALGVMGASGETINLLNAALPVLVLVIALTDGMHLMIAVLRRREEGAHPHRAGAHAIRSLGRACMLTSLTTAIGFASLAVSDIEVIRRFGLVFAGAVGLTFLAVITVVPLLGSAFLRRTPSGSAALQGAGLARPFELAARAVVGRSRLVTALGTALTVGMAAVSLQMVPDNRLTEAVPHDHAAARTLERLEAVFGGSVETSILVEFEDEQAGLDAMVAVEERLAEEPFATGSLSIVDVLRSLPGGDEPRAAALELLPAAATRNLLRRDLGRALIRFRVPDEGAAVAEPGYARIQDGLRAVEAAHPGVRLHLTGTGYVARTNVNVIIEDFALGLWVAALTIVFVLAAAFRSLRLGLLSVIPNAFPLAVAGSVLAGLGLELQVSSVLAFTVCLGIAVDDTIHLVSRYRAERLRGRPPEEAAVRAVTAVGRALVITTLVLVGGWGMLLLSEVPTTQLFGVIGLVGLTAALVGDLILLPAMLVAFDPDRRSGATARS